MIKKIFIIAGEASGDLLGSKLLRELKISNPQIELCGVGGQRMKDCGFESIFPLEDLAVMGFLEVVPHIPKLLKRINQVVEKIQDFDPDILITIDSPDFCFRVLKKLKKTSKFLKIKKVHLIAPSVWAYREGRAKKIAKLYDLLLAILPFEPPYFEKYGLKTVFIGHPLIDDAPDFSQKNKINAEFREFYKIFNDDKIILVTPGSRVGEVKRIFPEFIEAINLLKNKVPNIKIVIPIVKKTKNIVEILSKKIAVEYFLIEQQNYKKMAYYSCDFALAKSGTNAIEISLHKIPLIIAYKINFLTHFIVKRMIKIKYANLLNLIANKEIIPELLQKKCNKNLIYEKVLEIIENKDCAQKQIEEANVSLEILGLNKIKNPMNLAVNEILKL
jgi:lipid-A-disaccharide synthase